MVQNREIFVKQLPLISPRTEIDNVVRDSNVYGSINPIADAALVKVTNPSIIFRADEILTHNGLADITLNVVEKGGLSGMIAGNVVKIAEIKNDGYGGLQYQNATVTMDGYTLLNQAIANYSSTKGDSGSPTYSDVYGTDVRLLGIHVGKGCFITEINDNPFTIPGCDANNKNALFKVFSPWENVVSELGIQ